MPQVEQAPISTAPGATSGYLQATRTGLTNATTCPVNLRALNSSGDGAARPPVAVTPVGPVIVPAPPTPAGPRSVALNSTGAGAQHVTVPLGAGDTLALLKDGLAVPAVSVDTVGVYTLEPTTNVITFTPVTGCVGTPAGVTFQVTDASNRSGTALYTPTVARPAPPAPGVFRLSRNERGGVIGAAHSSFAGWLLALP